MKGYKILENRSRILGESADEIKGNHCPNYIDLKSCDVKVCSKDYCSECWKNALEMDYPLVAKIYPTTIDGLIFDENSTLVINEKVYTFKELKKIL